MAASRWLWAVLILLAGCRETSPSQLSESRPAGPIRATDVTGVLHPEFEPIPAEVLDVIQARRQYAGTLEVDPDWPRPSSVEAIRRELVLRQPAIRRMVEAARQLHGTLPPAPVLSDDQVAGNAHLTTVRGRLLNSGRDLLLADAVRCADEDDGEGCAERMAAAIRIATYLLNQEDRESRFRGGQVLTAAVFELVALLDNAPETSPAPPAWDELGQLLREAPTDRLIIDGTGTKLDTALRDLQDRIDRS